MDILDSVRTLIALVVGYIVAITGIELLPVLFTDTVVIPASVGLAAGVLATLGCRRLLGTTNYATLTGAILFFVVGGVVLAQGGDGPVAAEQARLLLVIGVVGFIANELLVSTSQLITAGGTDQADRHRLWAVPAAIVGLCVIIGRKLDFKSDGPLLAWGAVVLALSVDIIVASTNIVVYLTPPFTLVACSLFILFPVTSPQRLGQATGEGSVTGALWACVVMVGARCSALCNRGGTAVRSASRRFRAVVRGFSLPGWSSQATATGETNSARRSETSTAGKTTETTATADTRTAGQRDTTKGESVPSFKGAQSTAVDPATDGGTVGTQAATDSSTEAPQTTANTQSTTDPCQNCGRRHSSVRKRPVVVGAQTTNRVALCACCHAARRCPDTERRRGESVPVDRSQVLAASDRRCRACGCGPEHSLELHPIVPLERRGHPHEQNIVALCPACHAAAHNHDQ